MGKITLSVLTFSMTTLCASLASAQSFPFQGFAKDPAVGARSPQLASGGGKIFAIGWTGAADGPVHVRDANGWSLFDGTTFKHISASGAGIPWAIKTNGSVFKWNSVSHVWEPKGQAGTCAREVAAGATDNDVWVTGGCSANADTSIWRYNSATNSFSQPQVGAAAAHIAIGSSSSTPWVISSAGAVYKWNGTSFGTALVGCATAVGGDGWVVGCGDRKAVYKYDSSNQPTTRATASAALKGISSGGLAAVDDSGGVYLQSKLTSFTATGFSTPQYAISVLGTGYAPSKTVTLNYKHATTGVWKQINQFTTTSSGAINFTQSSVAPPDCSTLQMRRNDAVFRNMQLRIDVADGNSTFFNSPVIYDVCSPFLTP